MPSLAPVFDEPGPIPDGVFRAGWTNDSALHPICWQLSAKSILAGGLHTQILAAQMKVLPKSTADKAARHSLALWDKLTIFLKYPVLELSNNPVENSMHPGAIGRRNWIYIGHKQAGPKIAAIFSFVGSCRRLGIPVRDYLADVLPGLASRSIQSLKQLTQQATQPTRQVN
jgi:transposase